MEGEGSSEMEYTEIEANDKSLDAAAVFHVIKNVVGFVLYMHQQIPSTLQDLSLEFDALQAEYKELEAAITETEAKASFRRKHMIRKREVKRSVIRLEKFMNAVNGVESALQLMIGEVSCVEGVLLVLGASPVRPQFVYDLCFSYGNAVPRGPVDFSINKPAEGLSRKAIRALISKDAGSGSYPGSRMQTYSVILYLTFYSFIFDLIFLFFVLGPTKLFLLVKAPSSINLPLHFLPKREFRYSKKIVPFRLQLRCRSKDLKIDAPDCSSLVSSSLSSRDSTSKDLIWFQCRHVIKGLEFKNSPEE